MLYYQRLHPEAHIPDRAYDHAIGYDLYACLITVSGRPNVIDIPPNFTRAVPTKLILATSPGYRLEVCSRSGLSLGDPPIFVANAPGIIDPDYRGEVKVILFNGGRSVYRVEHRERIAQVVICPAIVLDMEEKELENEDTPRGARGYGSTGKH